MCLEHCFLKVVCYQRKGFCKLEITIKTDFDFLLNTQFSIKFSHEVAPDKNLTVS